MIDLSDYCATGTTADQSPGLAAAVAAAGPGGAIQVTQGGTYRLDSRVDCTGLGAFFSRPDAYFDGTRCHHSFPLLTFGARGPGYLSQRTDATQADIFAPLGADVAAGVNRILVTGLDLVPGQIVLLSTKRYYLRTGNADGLWNPVTTFYYRGEMAQVWRVDGVKVILRSPLRESYEAAKTEVYPLPLSSPTVVDLRILRASEEVFGMAFQFVQDAVVLRPWCSGSRERAIELVYGWRSRIIHPYVRDAFQTTDGNNYGVALSTCHECEVIEPDVAEAKHAGEEGGYEHCWNCRWLGGTLKSYDHGVAGVPAFWTHQNSRGSQLVGVRVDGGVGWTGIDSTAQGCVVLGKSNQSPFLMAPSMDCDHYRILNTLSDAGPGQFSWISPSLAGVTVNEVTWDGGSHGGGLFGFSVNDAGLDWTLRRLNLTARTRWKPTGAYTVSVQGKAVMDRMDLLGTFPGGVYVNLETQPAAGRWPGKAVA